MAEQTETKTTTARNRVVRRNFISECRESRIVVPVQLSQGMQRIYRRHFDRLSRAVFLFRYYSRIARGNAVESTLSKEIIASMDEANENLKKKIGVADQLLQKNEVTVKKAQFDKVNVTIIDPLANRFLQSIVLAQELNEKLSALWLACVLDDDQHSKAERDIENELRGIKDKCTTISFGVRDRVNAQRAPIEQTSGIAEVETGEDEENRTETGSEDVSQNAEIVEKTTTGRKTRKSNKEDAAAVEIEADNREDIDSSKVIEAEIAEDIAA